MTPTRPPHRFDQRVLLSLIVATTSGILCVALFYLILIRPFSSGFNLASVSEGNGVQAHELINDRGQLLQNHLAGVRALILEGQQAGSLATLEAIEQVLGDRRPIIYGLEVEGKDDDALLIGIARPGAQAQTYRLTDGVLGNINDQELEAEVVEIDQGAGIYESLGTTRVVSDGLELESEHGIRVTAEGDFEVRGTGHD